jgi:Las17-binding protein actin regulator
MAGTTGFKLGGQAELTLGTLGRNADLSINASGQGVGATVAISFTKGAFGGIALEGAVIGSRTSVNKTFYKQSYTPIQILYEDTIKLPEGTLMPEVYAKLNKLMEGETVEPTHDELTKVEVALDEANKLGEEAAKDEPDIVLVDAKAEAAKEGASSSF